MPALKIRHGEPTMIDYTPPGIVTAGDVIIVNDTPCIAHHDFATGELGALAAIGGVHEGIADGAIPSDKKVYWDAATKMLTLTATNKVIGVTVNATTGAGLPIWFRHDPGA